MFKFQEFGYLADQSTMNFSMRAAGFGLLGFLVCFQPLPALAGHKGCAPGLLEKLFSEVGSAVPISRRAPVPIAKRDLSSVLERNAPWRKIAANSEQRQPVYLGSTPREIEFHVAREAKPSLPRFMSERGEDQAALIRKHLGKGDVEFEAWPARNDNGQLTWVYSRWRKSPGDEWKWLDQDDFANVFRSVDPEPILPRNLVPSHSDDFAELFLDFLKRENLYAKPAFGDVVWTDKSGKTLRGAWLPVDEIDVHRVALKQDGATGLTARVLPQPSRFNGEATSFVLPVKRDGVKWPKRIAWKSEAKVPQLAAGKARVLEWPENFRAAFQKDVEILSGESTALFPISGRKVRFISKNSASPDNQLLDFVQYLEERYQVYGIPTRRQEFVWRGVPQSNLIAVIPGSAPPGVNKPVLVLDHIDTAFAEEVFEKSGKRVSVPGADDNVTATAGLLRTAEVLKDSKPTNDIWLVHLTGEEFPADDLGARIFVQEMLKQKQDIRAALLMDMIGHNKGSNRLFQISAGDSSESLRIAAQAEAASRAQVPWMDPVVRRRFDSKSYLYNTDGLIFSDAGFPVVLFNERLNRFENLTRAGYHDMTDIAANIDWEYATSILKAVIETAAREAL